MSWPNRPQPFATIKQPGWQPLELHAIQRDDGAWDAIAYMAESHRDFGEIGTFRFSGIAATQPRAEGLAMRAASTECRRLERYRAESEERIKALAAERLG